LVSRQSRTLFHVLNEYGLSNMEADIIRELKEGKVWLVQNKKTGKRYVLKRLSENKTNFPVLLHSRLYEAGFYVPKVFQTKTKQYYVLRKNRYYYLMDYVSIRKTKPSFQQRIEGLARFHVNSLFAEWIGAASPSFPDSKEVLRAHRQKVAQLQELTKKAANESSLSHIMKQMTQLADQSYELLEKSDLAGFCLEAAERKAICHGDYNSNNLLLAENNEVIMIDFDLAYYGLPLDDFRFLLVSLMKNSINNATKNLESLFELYFSICLPYAPYKNVYLADALFPHMFYNEAVNVKKTRRAANNQPSLDLLARIAEQETKKFVFLSDFLKSEGSRT